MGKSILKDKSYAFSLLVISRYKILISDKKEFVISKQFLRSGTAIGALIREAEFAESKKDFVHKLSIALKEANETLYWMELMKDSDYLNNQSFENLYSRCRELVAMLVSTIKTAKPKNN
ncbi:four helix bundle protein [Zunongwangia sp. H14]|uniref:four helix bundle protein n=1 Tax=Zunongwangia sp. H14 TaxID=3240792 RepID=UPI003563F2AD